jgi:hypothetical protein
MQDTEQRQVGLASFSHLSPAARLAAYLGRPASSSSRRDSKTICCISILLCVCYDRTICGLLGSTDRERRKGPAWQGKKVIDRYKSS